MGWRSTHCLDKVSFSWFWLLVSGIPGHDPGRFPAFAPLFPAWTAVIGSGLFMGIATGRAEQANRDRTIGLSAPTSQTFEKKRMGRREGGKSKRNLIVYLTCTKARRQTLAPDHTYPRHFAYLAPRYTPLHTATALRTVYNLLRCSAVHVRYRSYVYVIVGRSLQ